MRKILLFTILMFLIAGSSLGQSMSNYAFSFSTSASLIDISTGSTQLVASNIDDTPSGLFDIGFTFIFMGGAYTQFSASPDGFIKLGPPAATSQFTNSTTSTTNIPKIYPRWDDLATGVGGYVRYKVIGVEPNRQCVIEWFVTVPRNTSGDANTYFQAILNETSGIVEFIYGNAEVVTSGYSVGMTSSATQFASVTVTDNTVSYATANDNNNTAITAGLNYTFTPPATVPTSPTNLTFSGVGLTAMTLNWDDSPDETNYVVYRSTDDINYTLVTTTPLATNTVTYTATGLTLGTLYYWRVIATNEARASAPLSGSQSTSAASLTGTKYVGTGSQPQDYATITAALADLNAQGLAGPVILVLQSGYTSASETYPLVFSNLPGLSASNTLTIYPSSDASGLTISGSNATALMDFNGGNYVTIDGRPGGTGANKELTISNTSTSAPTVRYINGASNNTLKYCTVQGVATSITSGVVLFSTSTAATGNNNNIIEYCNLRDGASSPANIIYSSGTSGLANTGNIIRHNNIFDWFHASSTDPSGIALSANNMNWTINGNSLYQTVTRTTATNVLCGISTLSTTANAGHIITNNYIGGSGPNATGTWTQTTSANQFTGLRLTTTATPATSVQGNVIKNISISSTTSGTSTCGIRLVTGSFNAGNITPNTIADISFTNTGTSTGVFVCGILAGTGTPADINISNNIIENISVSATGTGSITLRGISTQAAGTSWVVSGNTVRNLTNNTNNNTQGIILLSTAAGQLVTNNTVYNIARTNTSSTGVLVGINCSGSSGGSFITSGNTVYNLSSASSVTGTSSSASVIGLVHFATTTAGQTVTQNTIYNLSNTNTTTATTSVVGLLYSGPTSGDNIVSRNLIYGLNASGTGTNAAAPRVTGLEARGGLTTYVNNMVALGGEVTNEARVFGIQEDFNGGNNFYHNSVNITGGATAGTNRSYAFARTHNSSANIVILNNIFRNIRTGGGGNIAIAHLGTAANGWTGSSSNYNVFHTGNANEVGQWFSTGSPLNLSGWINASLGDANSSFGNPQFLSATDLHIDENVATPIEGAGTLIASVTVDFDGDIRADFSPVDIGADAGDFISLDIFPPVISYSPLLNTTSTDERSLTVTVTDEGSGVPTTAPGWPHLYWRVNAGSWNTSTPQNISGNDFEFNLGDNVSLGDIVQYYVVAQDGAATPNVTAYPSAGAGGFTANPPAAATPPTNPSSYQIVGSPLSGDYTVGLAEFNRITGRNVTFEKVVSTVLREVQVEVPKEPSIMVKGMEPLSLDESIDCKPQTITQLVEVEEITWVPFENGKVLTEKLYAGVDENPGLVFPRNGRGVYATITEAINDLNLRGVGGNVNFLLTDASYTIGETFPIVVNITNENLPSQTKQVTLKPDADVVALIQGSSPNAQIFKILNSYFNIDGSNSGGSDRSLTIENTSTTSPQAILIGSLGTNPISGVKVKNSTIINGAQTSSAIVVSDAVASGTPGYFNNIALQNLGIKKAYIGIYCNAVPVGENGNGLLIENNQINYAGADGVRLVGVYVQGAYGATVNYNTVSLDNTIDASNVSGIWFATGTTNSAITNNTVGPLNGTLGGPRAIIVSSGNAPSNVLIQNNVIAGVTTSSTGTSTGITVTSTTAGVTIEKNRISNVKNTNTGGWGCNGIWLASTSTSSTAVVKNNFIYDIAGYGYALAGVTDNGYGIIIVSGAGYEIYHNSVLMSTNQNQNGLPAAFNITSGVTYANAVTVLNNIFSNIQTVGTNRYAAYIGATNTVLADMNYNCYYTTGPNLGYIGGINRADLPEWRTGTGKDLQSVAGDPQFISSTDLHINPAIPSPVDNAGFYLASVTDDIDGDVRQDPPDIGADEYTYTPPACPVPTSLTTTNIISTSATLNWVSGGVLFKVKYNQGSNFDPNTAGTSVSPDPVTNSCTISGLTPGQNVYWYVKNVCSEVLESDWAGPASFTTQYVEPVPYEEGFLTTSVPVGWNTSGWIIGSARGVTGNPGNNIYKNLWASATTGTFNTVNIGPIANGMKLTFDWIAANYSAPYGPPAINSGNYVIAISTDYGNTYTNLETVTNNGIAGWQSKEYDLSAFAGNDIKIRIVGTWSSGDYDLAFDNFKIALPPSCPAPTALTATNITPTTADLGWTPGGTETLWHVEVGAPGFAPGTGAALLWDYFTPNNPWLASPLTPATDYEFYVKAYCNGFDNPRIGNFWATIGEVGDLREGGGTFNPELQENGEWYLYENAPGHPWWNIWWYNDPLDLTRMKKIRVGFWVTTFEPEQPGILEYVVNWSTPAWVTPPLPLPGFPLPSQEMFIQRSPMRPPIMIAPGTPQWVELLYIVEEFNPEWVSLDIWGENFVIEMAPMAPPPDSPLFEYWEPTMMGGIIVHECLPKDHNTSSWSGPKAFSTPELCPTPSALDATGITANSANLSWTENGTATSWDIEFGATPYTFTGTPTLSGVTNPYPLGGLSSNTEYTYKVRAVCGEVFSNWAGPKVFTTLVSCPAPTGLTTVSTSADGAVVQWTSTAAGFEIEYGEAPYTFTGTANITGIPSNTYTFTGLLPAKTYQYKVKAICGVGDESVWSAMGSFTTQCVPIGLPWCENFDAVTAPAIPTCMTVTNDNNDAYQWITSTANPYSSPNSMYIRWNTSIAMNDWFFSPGLNLQGGVEYKVEFYYRAGSTSWMEKLKVMWGTSPAAAGMTGGTIWDNPGFTNTTYALASGTFTPVSSGVYYIGWHGYSITNQFTIYVDDICVTEVEPEIPDNLTLTGPITGVDCFNANISVTINGATVESGASADIRSGGTITATNFEVKSGGTALLKAVTSITLNDGVLITPGIAGYFKASIGEFEPCVLPLAMVASEEVVVPEELPEITSRESFFKVFPNPTTGSFNLELTGETEETRIIVEVYSMMGDRLLQNELYGMMRYEFNLSELPRGVYLIRVMKGTQMGVERLIKQ